MKHNIKKLSILAVTPLLLGLASCGGDNPSPSGPVEVHFWHTFGSGAVAPAVQAAADKFAQLVKENEGTEVKITLEYQGDYTTTREKIEKSFSAGTTPTIAVAYPDHVANYLALENNPGQFVYNLADYVNDEKIGFTKQAFLGENSRQGASDFIASFYDEGKQYAKEGIYSLPLYKSSEVMCYNEDALLREMKFWKPEIVSGDALKDYMTTLSWVDFIALCKDILVHKETVLNTMDVPLYYDSDANFFISKICQLEIPYASIDSNGKGHIDFETGAARTKAEELLTHIKGLYDDGVLRTKGTENKYGSDFFKNGKCLFTVGSSGGTGYSMPDGDAFKYNVCRVPSSSSNPENTNLYVSQGPTITFLKNSSLSSAENDRRMHYAWMFAKYITSTNVNADLALNHSEGYIPVRKSAFSTDLYNEWLENDVLVTKSADVLVNDIAGNYLNTKVFKGSAELREQVSGVIATICKQSISVTDALGSAINVAKTFM